MNCDVVHDLVGDVFSRLGRFISRHPIVFVIAPILVSCATMSGLYKVKFFRDYEELYVPRNARSLQERKIVEELYPMNLSTNFDIMRMTRLGQVGMIIITPKDNGTVLRKEIVRRYLQIDKIVHKIAIYNGDRKVSYEDVCVKRSNTCYQDEFFLTMKEKRVESEKIPYPFKMDTFTYHFLVTATGLGGVEVDKDGYITLARAFRLTYFLDGSGKEKLSIVKEWEESFVKTINSLEFDDVDVSAFATVSVDTEVHRITESALPLMRIAGPLMLFLYVVTCLMTDWAKSKPWLGISGFLTAGMAVGSAFGLLIYCNVDFIDPNAAVALVIIILQMNNTYVFLAEWRSTNPTHSVEKRMGDTYLQAGPVISLCCLATGSCFILGCATPYYAIQLFALYTIVAIMFTFAYCVTFFGGCLALSGQREENKLHPFTCLPVITYSTAEKRSALFKWCCTGGNHSKDFQSTTKDTDNCCMWFFRNKMGIIAKYKLAKILIATIFAAYLIVAGWLFTRIKGGFEYTSVFPQGTYGSQFAKLFYRYFTDYPQRLQIIVNTTMDYSQPDVQEKINALVKRFEDTPYTGDETLTESWLKYFGMFANDLRGMFILYSHDLGKKADFLDALRNYFLEYETAAGFKSDVKFNMNKSEIVTTRFLVQLTNLHNCTREMEMVEHMRSIADSFDFPVYIHDIWFTIYDIFLGIKRTFLQFCLTSLFITVVLFFVFAPSVIATLCVFLSFTSIQIGTLAYGSLWNVDFNVISAFSQMGCTVIPVIYLIQLPYAYHRSDGKRRIQQAFYFCGMPIFQNTVATTAGIFVLSFASVPIFSLFFKVFFLVTVLSVLHTYFVIPIILSFYESMFPQATIRRKRSIHRPSLRSSLRRSSIVSAFKASIRTNKEPEEDTKPMSMKETDDPDSDLESGISHSFSELSNNVFEFEEADLSDSGSS